MSERLTPEREAEIDVLISMWQERPSDLTSAAIAVRIVAELRAELDALRAGLQDAKAASVEEMKHTIAAAKELAEARIEIDRLTKTNSGSQKLLMEACQEIVQYKAEQERLLAEVERMKDAAERYGSQLLSAGANMLYDEQPPTMAVSAQDANETEEG